MDDLTRERHPYPIPERELRARPLPIGWRLSTPAEIAERRIVLCGGDEQWLIADRVLADAIRRYAAAPT